MENIFSNLVVWSPFGRINSTSHTKSNSVFTGVPYFEKIGARRAARWGPLWGHQGGTPTPPVFPWDLPGKVFPWVLLRVPCVVRHTAEPRGPKRTWQGMAPVAVCGLCSAFGRGQYGAPPYSTWRAHHGPCAAYTPTFHSKSNLVCTRVGYFDAVGAGRAARHRPLGGREGAGIACTLAANAQRGVPGRIVMCHPNPPPSFARRGGSGPGTIRSLPTY